LRQARLTIALRYLGPAVHDRLPRGVIRKSLLPTERDRRLCPLLDGMPLPPKLMEHSSIIEGQSQVKGVRQLPSQDQCLVAPCQRLDRIAQKPQGMGHPGPGEHPRVRRRQQLVTGTELFVDSGFAQV
jgi:hypothetical protein